MRTYGRRIIPLLFVSFALCSCRTIVATLEAEHSPFYSLPSAETAPPATANTPAKVDVLSSEWQVMSNEEKIAACQLPEDVLYSMSTGELVAAVLAYPLIANMVADTADHDYTGAWAVYYNFNGLRELTERKDAMDSLFEYMWAEEESLLHLQRDVLHILISWLAPFISDVTNPPGFSENVPAYAYFGPVYSDEPATDYSIDVPYVYLLMPESEIVHYDIPQDITENMTTRALLQTVLNYPLLANVYAFDFYQMGFSSVFSYCTPLRELCRRPDALYEIMRYQPTPDDVLTQGYISIFMAYQPLYYGR